MIWRWISPDGACCDFKTEVFAREMEKASPGSRVVELAPVDPLERAVVEAAVAYAQAREPDDDASQDLCSAVTALLAAKDGA